MKTNFNLNYYDSVIEGLTKKMEIHQHYIMSCKENGIFVSSKAELKFLNEHFRYLINQSKKEENLTNGIYQMWVSREMNHVNRKKRAIMKSLRRLYIKYESQKDLTIA